MKVILINGPARSGKDSLATAFRAYAETQLSSAEVVKFAQPLKEAAHRLFHAKEAHDSQEAVKDEPQSTLYGKTWRQVYIAVSERLFKPLFGENIFGRMLVESIETFQKIAEMDGEPETDFFLVSDTGFIQEAQEVVKRFGVENVVLVRLRRDGYDFSGDSRGYVELPTVQTLNYNLGDNLSRLPAVVENLYRAVGGLQ